MPTQVTRHVPLIIVSQMLRTPDQELVGSAHDAIERNIVGGECANVEQHLMESET